MATTSTSFDRDYARLRARGSIANRRITLIDPDNPRVRQVYEDLDIDEGSGERMVLVTLYPECSRAQAAGLDDDGGMIVVTHAKAVADIDRMLALGYRIHRIARDL